MRHDDSRVILTCCTHAASPFPFLLFDYIFVLQCCRGQDTSAVVGRPSISSAAWRRVAACIAEISPMPRRAERCTSSHTTPHTQTRMANLEKKEHNHRIAPPNAARCSPEIAPVRQFFSLQLLFFKEIAVQGRGCTPRGSQGRFTNSLGGVAAQHARGNAAWRGVVRRGPWAGRGAERAPPRAGSWTERSAAARGAAAKPEPGRTATRQPPPEPTPQPGGATQALHCTTQAAPKKRRNASAVGRFLPAHRDSPKPERASTLACRAARTSVKRPRSGTSVSYPPQPLVRPG